MAIPDNNTFSLQDVVDEMNPPLDTLVSALDISTGIFDPAYVGDKDRLSNFRNHKKVWELSEATWMAETSFTANVYGMWFNPDGSSFFYNTFDSPDWGYKEYSNGSSFGIDSLSLVVFQDDNNGIDMGNNGYTFSSDGTKMSMIHDDGGGGDPTQIRTYDLSTPWDVTSYSTWKSFVPSPARSYGCFHMMDGGNRLYTGKRDGASSTIRSEDLNTSYGKTFPYNPSIADASAESSVFHSDYITTRVTNMFINPDETRAFLVGFGNGASNATRIHQYNFGTAGDVTTLTHSYSLLLSDTTTGSYGGGTDDITALTFSPDGAFMYVYDDTEKYFIQYDMRH